MKKLLGILIVIFSVGCITSAILAGRVYYQNLRTYKDYDKKELDPDAMENVYIKSLVPVDIYPTTGEPYVEFDQTFVDLVGIAPKYELKVKSRENSTYINLDSLKDILWEIGVKENTTKLTVYLPQKAISRLSIENVRSWGNKDEQNINLEGINVQELEAKLNVATVSLDGAYENINLKIHNGTVNLNAKEETQIFIDGNVQQYLKGKIKKLTINNGTQDINVDSEMPANVQIESYDADIRLKGQYERVKLEGNSNNIIVNSETEAQLITKGQANQMTISGAFKNIALGESGSEIEMQAGLIPEKFQLGGCEDGTNITLTLPSNIPGFSVRYMQKDKLNQDKYEAYENYLLEENDIVSDFKLNSSISEKGEVIYTYGNGKIPLMLKGDQDISLNIIDGGYKSSTK